MKTFEVTEQDDGTFQTEDGKLANEAGLLLNEEGALINEEGALINEAGLLLNDEGALINEEGALIDEDGKVIDDPGKKKDIQIPKGRFDKANVRAKEAERALKAAQKKIDAFEKKDKGEGTETVIDFQAKIDEIDLKIEEARADGTAAEVADLTKQVRAYERAMYGKMAEEAASKSGTATQNAVQLDTVITTLESEHSILNPDSDDYDEALVDEIVEMQEAYELTGMTPAAAMLKAVGYILPDSEAAAARKTDVKKNIDDAKKIPGKQAGAGSDKGGKKGDDEIDPSKLSQKEFDALPSETKKRLRGDIV